MAAATSPVRSRGGIFSHLYFQVCAAVVLGIALGYFFPGFSGELRPVADGFIRLIRMLLAPIIFATVVLGIARMESLKEVGRIGLKALVYFEVVSTLALVIGLVVVNVLRPGAGMNVNPATLDAAALAPYTRAAAQPAEGVAGFLLNMIPTSLFDAFARNDMLQIIVFAVLLGVAMARYREKTRPLLAVMEATLHGVFGIVAMVMRLAPLGAGAGMAFTVGKYGIGSLLALGKLVGSVYLTSLLFLLVVLAPIARLCGLGLGKFIWYLREEIVIVFATASTESVLPRMVEKLEWLGCARPIVGLVLPAGYTFNPDGTAIYLTMASIFIAQATNTPLTLGDQLVVLGVLMATSKGSAGVAGAGFVTLAAALTTMHRIPPAGLVLLLGVDRFINEVRAVTNLIGNGVATVAIARWESAFDLDQAKRELARPTLRTEE